MTGIPCQNDLFSLDFVSRDFRLSNSARVSSSNFSSCLSIFLIAALGDSGTLTRGVGEVAPFEPLTGASAPDPGRMVPISAARSDNVRICVSRVASS